MDSIEVKLPSGATLTIQPSPFAVAKELFQTLLRELQSVQFSTNIELSSLFKDLFCIGFSSPAIDRCIQECFKRCTYGTAESQLKIDKDTFEPLSRRQDYPLVCTEVVKANVNPFLSSLYAEYSRVIAMTEKSPQSK